MPKRPSPDDDLAGTDFPALNHRFYKSSPVKYFEFRRNLLLLAAGKPHDLYALLESGVTVGELTIHFEHVQSIEEQAKEDLQMALADAEVLFHHAAETLLRLYLSHADMPPCPMLEIARVRTPSKFKEMVNARVLTPAIEDMRTSVATAFLGNENAGKLGLQTDPERWLQEIDKTADWLKFFAEAWIDGAPLYNSAKHGLNISPGEGGLRFGERDDGSHILNSNGTTISYLELREDSEGARRWFQTMQFVDLDERLVRTSMCIDLMRMLWEVARARYEKAELKQITPMRVSVADYLEASLRSKPDLHASAMSIELAYWMPPLASD